MSREFLVLAGQERSSPPRVKKDPGATLDFSFRWGAPQWQAATAYSKGDYVLDPADGNTYQAKESHTSDASARANDVGKWREVPSGFFLDDEGGEVINAHVWTVPAGLTKVSEAISSDGKVSTVFLSGGTAGTDYEVVCQITTDNATPRIDERTLKVQVRER